MVAELLNRSGGQSAVHGVTDLSGLSELQFVSKLLSN